MVNAVRIEEEGLLLVGGTAADAAFQPSEHFSQILEEVREAIASGVHPTLIPQGSSGSYFCRNKANAIVAVFKPKDEEPYGEFNPKYGKWLQRTLCPCCFGRSCLLANQGYLSEAAASVVAQRLGLAVVPETAVVRLRSPAFNYSYLRRELDRKKLTELPEKIGSFQLFVVGYSESDTVLREMEGRASPLDWAGLQQQFEQLVVLDYIIRNTDRGYQNWLVRWERSVHQEGKQSQPQPWPQQLQGQQQQLKEQVQAIPANFPPEDSISSSTTAPLPAAPTPAPEPVEQPFDADNVWLPTVRIAAIDNGLAFPFKHPDNWRSYPFAWTDLPQAQVPFSEQFAKPLLDKISSKAFRDRLMADIKVVMQLDKRYSGSLFEHQMSVMVGQMFNLAEVLRDGGSPADLVQKVPVTVNAHPERGLLMSIYRNRPCFSSC